MQILLTRPRIDSNRIAAELTPLGARCLIWPLTEITASVDRIEIPAGIEAIIFTSAHAVRILAELEHRRDLPVFCVGPRTERIAREAGFAEVINSGGEARDVAGRARDSGLKCFFYPRGRDVAQDLAALIDDAAIKVLDPIIYRADPGGPPDPDVAEALRAGSVDLFTIWSARNATLLAGHLCEHDEWRVERSDLVAISENAAEPLRNAGFRRIIIAERPNGAAMVAAITAEIRQKNGS